MMPIKKTIRYPRHPRKPNKTGRGDHLAAQARARAVPPPPTEQDIKQMAEIALIDDRIMVLNNKDRQTDQDRAEVNRLYMAACDLKSAMRIRREGGQ